MTDILNVEIKARCNDHEEIHNILKSLGADYKGCDHQIDTYFNCNKGRLKLRQGNIENSLIFYTRNNQAGPKESDIALAQLSADTSLKGVLEKSYGVKVEVDKKRHIYFIENVKFHLDEVVGLGRFMEIEAIDLTGEIGLKKLDEQCKHYMKTLNVNENDLIEFSYSDMLLT